MSSKLFTLLALAALCTSAIGCGSSMRLVRSSAMGGEIELEGAIMPATSAAHVAMAEHCGGRVRLLTEGEAASMGIIDASAAKPEGAESEASDRLFFACARAVD